MDENLVLNYISSNIKKIDYKIYTFKDLSYIKFYFDNNFNLVTFNLSKDSKLNYYNNTLLGVEIIFTFNIKFFLTPLILRDCSNLVTYQNYQLNNGVIFRDIVSKYYPNFNVKHIFFTYLDEYFFEDLYKNDNVVTFLNGIAITDSELQYLQNGNYENFTSLLNLNVDKLANLERDSLI